jgi:hypothetical protein
MSATPVRGSSGFKFSTFELGRFDVSGITCPGTISYCWNVNAEPQIRADRAGNFYASSEFLPRTANCSNGLDLVNPQCGGTGAWRSSDGGLHYTTLAPPNALSFTSNTLSPYGGDTDLATAPQKNVNGFYNVYVSSLERASGPLLTVAVSTSQDQGKTWLINPTAAQIPFNDRPWIAADGTGKVCLAYHNIATTFDILVSCSFDGGVTFSQVASAIDASHACNAEFNNQIGNIAIDPNSHAIYQAFAGINCTTSDISCDEFADCTHVAYVAVSLDGGLTFTDHVVYDNPIPSSNPINPHGSLDHQFVNISIDTAGNLYVVFSDNHNVFYSFSTNSGKTWSPTIQVNHAPSNTAIMPWSSAGSPGRLDIVWYGTSYFDGKNVPDNYPMSASWYVYFAQNLNSLSTSSSFTQAPATHVIHYGGVCEGGVSCTGNRDLFDDFGVAASPTTGLASIVYTDDQYVNSPTEPASPTCTPSETNLGPCDHTDIATQTSGTGIFG